jgi:hypothetical protein
MTQLGAGSAQIMRGKVIELKSPGTVPNNVPNHVFGDPAAPG